MYNIQSKEHILTHSSPILISVMKDLAILKPCGVKAGLPLTRVICNVVVLLALYPIRASCYVSSYNLGRTIAPITREAFDRLDVQEILQLNNYSNTDTYASVSLERLVEVNTKKNTAEMVIVVYVSWFDLLAEKIIALDTANVMNGSKVCHSTCDGKAYSVGSPCCDWVYAPYVHFSNAIKVEEVGSELVFLDGPKMGRILKFHGTFYQPMHMKSFPFGSLQLLIELSFQDPMGLEDLEHVLALSCDSAGEKQCEEYQHPPGRVIPSGATASTTFLTGDGSSLWIIDKAELFSLSSQAYWSLEKANISFKNDDPMKNILQAMFQSWKSQQPELHLIFSVMIQQYWVIGFTSNVLPLIMLTCVSLFMFLQPPDNLSSRLGSTIGLYWTLTSIQNNVMGNIPNTRVMTPLQKAIFVLYVMIFMGLCESLLVYTISRFSQNGKAAEAINIAFNPRIKKVEKVDEHENKEKAETTTRRSVMRLLSDKIDKVVHYRSLMHRLKEDDEYCASLARTIDYIAVGIWALVYFIAYLVIGLTSQYDADDRIISSDSFGNEVVTSPPVH